MADRDRLADRGQPARARADADQAGLADGAGARLRRAGARPGAATRCRRGTEGAICIKLPLPPGTLPTLWGDDERFVASYLSAFDGYYLTGDGGYVDDDGYLFVMGRTDDVINVAGHRLSTGSMEAVLAGHPAVAECAVIGVHDDAQGPGAARARGAQGRRRHRPGRSCAPSWCSGCATRSARSRRSGRSTSWRRCRRPAPGKILRRTMRGDRRRRRRAGALTIEDPAVLDALRPILRQT